MAGQVSPNQLWFGDNLEILRAHVPDESVDLVYLDPPFNSNRAFNVIFGKHPDDAEAVAAQIKAFDDTWHWTSTTERQYQQYIAGGVPLRVGSALKAFYMLLDANDPMAYLVNMAPRLVELRRVLKPTGSLYLHCDPTMSHYLKIMLDAIFGPEQFQNEISWQRAGAKNDSVRYGRCHDVILFYTVGRNSHGAPSTRLLSRPRSTKTTRMWRQLQDGATEEVTSRLPNQAATLISSGAECGHTKVDIGLLAKSGWNRCTPRAG